MSTYRRKSTTTTDESSSSSTGSSTSTGSTSGSDTGSTSSGSESSSTVQEKGNVKNADNSIKSQVITRRKSSDYKTGTTKLTADSERSICTPNAAVKLRSNTATKVTRNVNISSEDETPPNKKLSRSCNNLPSQRRKLSGSSSAVNTQLQKPSASGSGGKVQPGTKSSSKTIYDKQQQHFDVAEEHSDKDIQVAGKVERKTGPKGQVTPTQVTTSRINRLKQTRNRPQVKRNVSRKSRIKHGKSSEEYESGSASVSGDDSTTSESEEGTDSTNSFASHVAKAVKGKRAPSKLLHVDSDEMNIGLEEMGTRKLTRSLSSRRIKQRLKHNSGCGIGTESESDVADMDGGEKRSLSKSPAKKPASSFVGISKSKVKKENICTGVTHNLKPRSLSPPLSIDKKCPIEGCDSSGHLSGYLDKHFLPEACPIYHNMSVSECKERANERELRDQQQKVGGYSHIQDSSSNSKTLSPDQKEFLAKIKDSRARFRPFTTTITTDKVKLEKDCTDEDREPSLCGLVPDYDLQLFREAQAVASQKVENELKDLPVGKGIKYITMGKYKMKVWYQSPYPDDAARLPKMYICEFCLRYQKSETGIKRHAEKCIWRHPPGDEIYRKGKLQVWQVDGKRHKQYCQHLCLLAKFFLDHKTLYYDVEPFLFYIMTLADVDGCHTVGYFSKEKNSFYNVSCILTLPPYQRKGYGRLLIDFSYLLTRVEGKIGSPEKPLSDLGLISYRSYWKDVLLDYLCNRSGNTLSIKDVSQEMAIYSYDIVSTLQALGMMKYWKGKHIILKKQDVLDEYEERVKRRGNFPKIDDTCLRWSPFIPTQTNDCP